MALIPYYEWQEEQRRLYGLEINPHKNGIECPLCEKELTDTNPQVTLTSLPPQKDVKCEACGWVGYRIKASK